jgi:hypothetical protein
MTRSELDKVSARVGGMIHLTDMLTQITRAQHCPLVRALADRPKGLDALYDFFANGPGDPPAGYYLYIDKDTDPALAAYDTINLVYGYCAEVQAGEGYTFPFIKCADRRYALIKTDAYTGHIH